MFKKRCPVCKSKYSSRRHKLCLVCAGIDFSEIHTVEILNEQDTFRTVKEERFDAVSTNFLPELDGWQHYETETVEREVLNSKTYTFLIKYNSGEELVRALHEDSPVTERLLGILTAYVTEDDINQVLDIFGDLLRITVGELFDYCNSEVYFQALAEEYSLDDTSSIEDYNFAINDILTTLIRRDIAEYKNSIYSALFYCLAECREDEESFSASAYEDLVFYKTSSGTDAFIVLESSYNVNKELLAEYEAKRQQNSFRKIVILQYSDKMEKSSSPTLVAMDKKAIVSIYNKALKKAIFQSQQRKQSDV